MSFELQPELSGTLVSLRALRPEDGAYNREMKQLMLRHAFRFVDRVIFVVGSGNLRSQRAVQKIGGVRQGNRRGADGRENLVFELTRESHSAKSSTNLGL
jgi:hypothetical protein